MSGLSFSHLKYFKILHNLEDKVQVSLCLELKCLATLSYFAFALCLKYPCNWFPTLASH